MHKIKDRNGYILDYGLKVVFFDAESGEAVIGTVSFIDERDHKVEVVNRDCRGYLAATIYNVPAEKVFVLAK